MDTEKVELDETSKTFGYKYNLVTKYYTTNLTLCPMTCPIEECPLNLLNYVEGVLIYFDANNVSFFCNKCKSIYQIKTNISSVIS